MDIDKSLMRDVLGSVRQSIGRPDGWGKNAWGRWNDDDGFHQELEEPSMAHLIPKTAQVCLDGGLLRALAQYLPNILRDDNSDGDVWLDENNPTVEFLRELVADAIKELHPERIPDGYPKTPASIIPHFNDHSQTEKEDVQRVLERALQFLEEEAEDADFIKEVQQLVQDSQEMLRQGDYGGAAAKEYQIEQKLKIVAPPKKLKQRA